MFLYIWPIALVVLSNVVYQICAKSVPDGMNPFAALAVTYLGNHGSIIKELGKLNWAPFVLGLVIVGLEVGFIYAYKAGWQVSTAQLVASSALAIILIFVGFWLYKEQLTWNKLVGVAICLVGLFFINYKF